MTDLDYSCLQKHGKKKHRKIRGKVVNPLHLLCGLNTTESYSTEVGKKLEYVEVKFLFKTLG